MAFINTIINLAVVTQPTGMWEAIIFAFNSIVSNYVWAVILFTIILKLVLSPLDFFNKVITVKNTEIQKVIQPEIKKLEKLYGNNKQVLNQKMSEVYKKHNYNVGGSCLIMLVYLAVTLVIFITLFGSLRSIGSFKIQNQYQQLNEAYFTEYETVYTSDIKSNHETYNSFFYEKYDELEEAELEESEKIAQANAYAEEQSGFEESYFIEIINEAETSANIVVANLYNQIKDSWLWIANVWQPDVPWKNSILNYGEYKSISGIKFEDTVENEVVVETAAQKEARFESEYDKIMNPLREEVGRTNGFLIVVVLIIGLAVMSQMIAQGKIKFRKKNKKEDEEKPPVPGGLVLTVLMPLLFGYFGIMYNSVFALYMMTSTAVTLALTPLFDFIIKKLKERKKAKDAEKKPNYVR